MSKCIDSNKFSIDVLTNDRKNVGLYIQKYKTHLKNLFF